jgi:hypothetical protein
MALLLFKDNGGPGDVEISSGSDFTSPIMTSHDGKNGDSQKVLLYIKNDNPNRTYSNVVITPTDLELPSPPKNDTVYTDTGWGVKLSLGGEEPSKSQWEDIVWGAPISITSIAELSHSFWYLITCPPNTNAQNKTDIALTVSYTENVV